MLDTQNPTVPDALVGCWSRIEGEPMEYVPGVQLTKAASFIDLHLFAIHF
jgi:hypothetical protein